MSAPFIYWSVTTTDAPSRVSLKPVTIAAFKIGPLYFAFLIWHLSRFPWRKISFVSGNGKFSLPTELERWSGA